MYRLKGGKMKKKLWIGILITVISGVWLTHTACSKKSVISEPSVSNGEVVAQTLPRQTTQDEKSKTPDSDTGIAKPQPIEEKRSEDGQRRQSVNIQPVETSGKLFMNELVLFDFDSSDLTVTARERLRRKAQWLKEHPDASIIIQGHCDERGAEAYNLSLGEKRARAAQAFLVSQGIPVVRLSTVSYGEARPFVDGHDESAWSLNRRAHFVIE